MAGLFLVLAAGCRGGAESAHLGRWVRVDQPAEWVELRRDGTFLAVSFMEPDTIHGSFRIRGDTVLIHSEYGHDARLVARDGWLVHDDGTRMRRPPGRAPGARKR